MKTIKLWMMTAILTCGFQSATAQTLRGVVTDAISGEALIGATVKLVEADKGAVTDIDGNYRIESWKNVIFVPLSTWKSVRKQTYSHWKSVFYLLFMLVFK